MWILFVRFAGEQGFFKVKAVARTKGSGVKSERSASPPRRYVPVGDVFRCGRAEYRVVERMKLSFASQACVGCSFRDRFCPNVPCSAFDRPDGKFVWFQEIKDDEDNKER